jgi:hypothetical protein
MSLFSPASTMPIVRVASVSCDNRKVNDPCRYQWEPMLNPVSRALRKLNIQRSDRYSFTLDFGHTVLLLPPDPGIPALNSVLDSIGSEE